MYHKNDHWIKCYQLLTTSVTDNFLQKFPRLLVHVFKRFRSLSILIKSLVSNEIRVLKNTVEECTGVISLKSYAAE